MRPHLLIPAIALLFTVQVLAQTPPAPPRNVDDILAILEHYKPDPVAVEQLRAAVAAEPPATDNRQDLAIFYHRRSRANESLGRQRQRVADLNKALEYVEAGGAAGRRGCWRPKSNAS